MNRHNRLGALLLICLMASSAAPTLGQPTAGPSPRDRQRAAAREAAVRTPPPSPAPPPSNSGLPAADQGILNEMHRTHVGQVVFTREDMTVHAIQPSSLADSFNLGEPRITMSVIPIVHPLEGTSGEPVVGPEVARGTFTLRTPAGAIHRDNPNLCVPAGSSEPEIERLVLEQARAAWLARDAQPFGARMAQTPRRLTHGPSRSPGVDSRRARANSRFARSSESTSLADASSDPPLGSVS